MNIIIPLGGKGERFKNAGFIKPKPLIDVYEKPMILHVLDNLRLRPDDCIFIIYYDLDLSFETTIRNKYPSHPSFPSIKFVKLTHQTRGAAETIYIGLPEIIRQTPHLPCILLDCDTFYTEDVIGLYSGSDTNAVFYTHVNENAPAIFSYIELDECTHEIRNIREKEKISNFANTGAYCFCNIHELQQYSRYVVENDVRFNGEYYISCVISTMLASNKPFIGIELDSNHVFSLGTPTQLNSYLHNSYLFLFDLDGTLVLTDNIYLDVWKEILAPYNIALTDELFRTYIQGNSDENVLRQLMPNNKYNIAQISELKDSLFLKNIHKLQIISGAFEFLANIKNRGHRIAIVSNCNRSVATGILHHIQIEHLVDSVIIGGECKRPKPYPDPYLCAIHQFRTTNNNTIIFEDSKTGIQSGKNTFPKCLVGIETVYSHEELIENGVDISIPNYDNVDLQRIFMHNNNGIERIQAYIRTSLPQLNINEIQVLNQKLKGGFISDVVGVKIHIKDRPTMDCVLKLENKNETFLSKMARSLGLYEREYYFYESISAYVPIQIPEFYGIIKDADYNNVGILMENLANKNYVLGLDLNTQPVDVSLKIIDRLAKMHSRFWGKDLQKNFKDLKRHNDAMFNPVWSDFVRDRLPNFLNRWEHTLTDTQIHLVRDIVERFPQIQSSLSDTNLTLCHGDVKSANIFYCYEDITQTYEPYFIDWQYICEGKGVQDLVFFMIESFNVDVINRNKNLFKDYYYVKLLENGVHNYGREEYERDFCNAIKYFPFFVAIWFGTVSEDELIDKNFPFFFIQKFFNFIGSA